MLKVERTAAPQDDEWPVTAAAVILLQIFTGDSQPEAANSEDGTERSSPLAACHVAANDELSQVLGLS